MCTCRSALAHCECASVGISQRLQMDDHLRVGTADSQFPLQLEYSKPFVTSTWTRPTGTVNSAFPGLWK